MSRIIEIRSGATTAQISTKGAEIISFKGPDGTERIWQADPEIWGMRSPVLFPVVCAVKNNEVIIDGASYPMTKHGFVRTWEFEVAEQGESHADLVMIPDEESKKKYPFEYELHVCFDVSENSYSCTFRVVNKTDRMMPFCLGGHPGFICPTEEGSAFEDYEVVFSQIESGERGVLTDKGEISEIGYYEPLKGHDRFTLDHTFFDENDTIILPKLKSRSAKLVSKKSGHGINFSFGSMPVLAIWTKPVKHADYVCLEPWHGLPAGVNESSVLEDKPFAIKLAPGSIFETGYTASII